MDKPKMMLVSRSLPPRISGTSILLSNLLGSYPGQVEATACHPYSVRDSQFAAPCPTNYLKLGFGLVERAYNGGYLTSFFYSLVYRHIRKEALRMKPDLIMGVYPDALFFVSAFRVARKRGVPFYAYMNDMWQENYPPTHPHRRLAEKWEHKILRESTRVLCMTEFQQEFYSRKYGISSELLPHTIPTNDLESAPEGLVPLRFQRRTVLFVGNTSGQMNTDALKTLAHAAELLPSDFELLFCTSATQDNLKKSGISSPRLRVVWMPHREVRKMVSEADVLVAPLSHKNCSPDEVHTVFSTKVLEYLVSGRPIVVFAPGDSYQACSVKQNNWGYVVDRDDPRALAEGIMHVVENEDVARQLVSCALDEARRRDARIHAKRLYEWVLEDAK